jgi:hypothetical protein
VVRCARNARCPSSTEPSNDQLQNPQAVRQCWASVAASSTVVNGEAPRRRMAWWGRYLAVALRTCWPHPHAHAGHSVTGFCSAPRATAGCDGVRLSPNCIYVFRRVGDRNLSRWTWPQPPRGRTLAANYTGVHPFANPVEVQVLSSRIGESGRFWGPFLDWPRHRRRGQPFIVGAGLSLITSADAVGAALSQRSQSPDLPPTLDEQAVVASTEARTSEQRTERPQQGSHGGGPLASAIDDAASVRGANR